MVHEMNITFPSKPNYNPNYLADNCIKKQYSLFYLVVTKMNDDFILNSFILGRVKFNSHDIRDQSVATKIR